MKEVRGMNIHEIELEYLISERRPR